MKKLILTLVALITMTTAPAFASHPAGTIRVDVNGLVCDFCAKAIEKVFGREEAVDTVSVDLDEKTISIHLKEGETLDDEKITTMVNDSGYAVREIRREEQ